MASFQPAQLHSEREPTIGRLSQLKCRYSRLYFHEWEFSHEIRENIVPRKFRTI